MTSAHFAGGDFYAVDAAMTRVFCACQGSVRSEWSSDSGSNGRSLDGGRADAFQSKEEVWIGCHDGCVTDFESRCT